MDSERRHELETNELREFLDNFKDFWDKHGNRVLLTLIVVLGSYAGYNYYKKWKADAAETANAQLANANSPDALLAVANEHDRVHDEAMRRAGDLFYAQARFTAIDNEDGAMGDALKKAASSYTAIADRGKTDLYQVIGHEGLANVAVMQGEWDKAKTHYQKAIDLSGDTYLAIARRAEHGLEQLDQLKNPVGFSAADDFDFDDFSFNPDTTPSDGAGGPDDGGGPVEPVDPVEILEGGPTTPPGE